ncbi:MAG: type II toxin-antitoxin system PemK/MazF family toxin [Candidatus Binatia bacterium]|jgi:mRNA interferase MazF
MPQPRLHHGDVYIAQLDPTVGGEIRKTRPVVVVSNDAIPAGTAGLVVSSRILTDQVRAIDPRRLVQRIGWLPVGIRAEVKAPLRATFDL